MTIQDSRTECIQETETPRRTPAETKAQLESQKLNQKPQRKVLQVERTQRQRRASRPSKQKILKKNKKKKNRKRTHRKCKTPLNKTKPSYLQTQMMKRISSQWNRLDLQQYNRRITKPRKDTSIYIIKKKHIGHQTDKTRKTNPHSISQREC